MFCRQECPYCKHLSCFWIVLQWYRDLRGPPLYSELGDCPKNLILSFPSLQKVPTLVYEGIPQVDRFWHIAPSAVTEAALFT